MKPAPFDYRAPTTLNEALTLLAGKEDVRPIAGGQSLVPMLAFRLARPGLLIDLNRVKGMAGVQVRGDVLRIGAMTRQAAVLRSDEVAVHAPLLIDALHNVGHPPTRARGTIGGSLAHADPAAELPAVMVALDATMIAVSLAGERTIAAKDFFLGAFETALRPGELLAAIEVPKYPGGTAFIEVSARKGDFAIAFVAVRLAVLRRQCTSCAIVLGGIAERPVRCVDAEAVLTGTAPDDGGIERALGKLPLDSITMDSPQASAAYRKRVAPVLARRAIKLALSRGASS
jgi:carbon-monoxide dehydrogenase medium subunit